MKNVRLPSTQISMLALCKLQYPGRRVTSGVAQNYMGVLDRIFKPDGYRAFIVKKWDDNFNVISLDGRHTFNVSAIELPEVIVNREDQRK